MRWKRFLSLVPLIAVTFFILFILLVSPHVDTLQQRTVRGAHRGSSIDFIENTIPAFEAAVWDNKYAFIEFDVQYTKDKVMVVHHDLSLLRLQRQPYHLSELTYEELDFVSSYHIPTYKETLSIVGGVKPLNVEIKSQGSLADDERIADEIIADLTIRGLLKTSLVSSISSEVLLYIKEHYPHVKTGKVYYISPSTFVHTDGLTDRLYEELNRTHADYLMLHGSNLHNYDSLSRLLPNGKALVIWYFNDEMYILDQSSVYNPLQVFQGNTSSQKEPCGWWC